MEEIIKVNGIHLRVRIEGSGDTVILIHGVGRDLELWDEVAVTLKKEYRIVRYDLRGHGKSDKTPGPYENRDFVSDLAALLDALNITRCHIVGFSLGGLVAQGFAIANPDRIERLVLLSTVAGRNEEEKARVIKRLRAIESGGPSGHFANSVSRWFTEEFQHKHPEVIEAYAQKNKRNDPKAYAAAYRVIATTDLIDELSVINAPTLVATGEHDAGSNTRMAKLMHETIPGSRLRILPGLRHSLLVEAPEAIAELVSSFLADKAQERAADFTQFKE